jgi:hypothetical protein
VLEPVEPEPPGVNAEAHAETAAGERPTPCR